MAGVLDTFGMAAASAALPDQIEAAVALGQALTGLPAHELVANVVLLGVGDDGGAAEVVAAVVAPYAPVPVVVVDGVQLPSFVGSDTLVVAFSFAGDGADVLDAVEEAATAGAHLLAVCAPGPLADAVAAASGVRVAIAGDAPVARAAVGALVVPVLVALETMGLFSGAADWVALAVEQLRRRVQRQAEGDPLASDLARSIGRTFPLVIGAGDVGRVAARQWKARCNQNAKVPAWSNEAPALFSDELAGYGQHGDVTRQVLTLVTLRHDHEHPQLADRLHAAGAVLSEVVATAHEVVAEGEGELAQLLDLLYLADQVSFALAAHEGVDPGPTASLDRLRRAIDA